MNIQIQKKKKKSGSALSLWMNDLSKLSKLISLLQEDFDEGWKKGGEKAEKLTLLY